MADRYPSRLLLNSICAIVAFFIFGIAVFSDGMLSFLVDSGFGERSGPLVASMILFLLPSVGMGVVSPFAVKLATHSVSSLGRSAGTLYSLSTMGSIAGTLLTTFVFIPTLGLAIILKLLAAVMLLAAVVTMPFARRRDAFVWLIAATATTAVRTSPAVRLTAYTTSVPV